MGVEHYTGSCQCGAVRLSGRMDLSGAVTCNCSRCRRIGSVFVFAPASEVTIEGEEATTEFLFNRHAIAHRFCATCGVEVHARGAMPDGSAIVAVNANCLDGVDGRSLPARHHDGASL